MKQRRSFSLESLNCQKGTVFSIIVAVFVATPPAWATVRYAEETGLTSGSCDSWANACTLTKAIDVASEGDEIWVEAGTYEPIELKNGVKIYGGFDGTESAASQSDPTANETIIDGDGNRAVESTGDGPTTVLRGFTITNGVVSGYDEAGGGILLTNSAAMIVQCEFKNNTAGYFGGAVAIRGSSAPQFVNCSFHHNGEMTVGEVDYETLAGGAVFLRTGSATFTNCLFYRNKSGDGAAIAVADGTAAANNCTITLNEATVNAGGGIFDQEGVVTVKNSIIWGNTAEKSGSQIFNFPGRESTVTESDIQGGYTGTGNINSDPLFEDSGNDDFTLGSSSPCKNTASNSYIPFDVADIDWDSNTTETIPLDLKLEARKASLIVDMGCYEVQIGGGSS